MGSFSLGFTSNFTDASGLLSSDNFATYRNYFLADTQARAVGGTRLRSASPLRVMSRHKSSGSTVRRTVSQSGILPAISPFASPWFALSAMTLITTVLVNLMQQGASSMKIFYRYGCVLFL
jgi:hypothetical protein